MAFIHWLDLVGIFAFAAYGAHKAVRAQFDLFGVLTCAALTAFGGGTIRELILNGSPAYLYDYSYLVAALLGAAFVVVLHEYFSVFERYLIVIDAIGIAVFAYVGAYRADMAHLGLAAMVFFGTLTAVGGGILSDIVAGRRPEALYKDFYPLAAILLAVAYYLIAPAGHDATVALVLIAGAFIVRIVSVRRHWQLWRPHTSRLRRFTWRRKLTSSVQTSNL